MATVGKNILENLTTGMYYDSKVIYREYIQNACDQIDKAEKPTESKEKNASVAIKTFKERLYEYANSKGDEIAKKLKKEPKSIDNALNRIKIKLKYLRN